MVIYDRSRKHGWQLNTAIRVYAASGTRPLTERTAYTFCGDLNGGARGS